MPRIITAKSLIEIDKYNARRLVEWLKKRKWQGAPPITQKQILANSKDKQYTEHSLSALINFARLELDEWVASSNEGLYIAETPEEKKIFIEYQKSITLPRLETLRWAETKLRKELNTQEETKHET